MKKEKYLAPVVETMECRVERGYATSGGNGNPNNNEDGNEDVDDSGNDYLFS